MDGEMCAGHDMTMAKSAPMFTVSADSPKRPVERADAPIGAAHAWPTSERVTTPSKLPGPQSYRSGRERPSSGNASRPAWQPHAEIKLDGAVKCQQSHEPGNR